MTDLDADTPTGDDSGTEQAAETKPKLNLEVSVQKSSACERHVSITLPREDIERYFNEALDKLVPEAQVPGFRPGHAPRKLVQARFRKELEGQVKGSLVMDALEQASEKHDFSAISEPNFDFEAIELPEDGPMTFEFVLEVRPEFELPQWKGMSLKRPVREITDEDVERHFQSLRARFATVVPHDGPAEEGDVVHCDIEFKTPEGDSIGVVREQPLRQRKILSFRDGRLEGFDKLLRGAKAGDTREASVAVSPESPREELRGKKVTACFTVLDVKRPDLPAVERDFLDRLGGFESEQEVRDAIRTDLDRQLRYYQQRQVRQQITTLLTQAAGWQLPPDLVRRQARRELERAVLELRASGFSDEDIQAHANELRQNTVARTTTALKEHFILERIAEEEKIEPTPEDYDKEIELIAEQDGDSPRRVRARLEKRNQMDILRNQIIERKVIDLIISHASLREEPFTFSASDVEAIDQAIGGEDAGEIPDAKHATAEELRQPAERG
jgi:trigger factor